MYSQGPQHPSWLPIAREAGRRSSLSRVLSQHCLCQRASLRWLRPGVSHFVEVQAKVIGDGASSYFERFSSIVKITLHCKLLKTKGDFAWLGVRDSNYAARRR